MSSRRRLRRKACDGKVRHGTESEALRTMFAMRGRRLNVYRCSYCNGFHVGHRPRGRRTPFRRP